MKVVVRSAQYSACGNILLQLMRRLLLEHICLKAVRNKKSARIAGEISNWLAVGV